MSVPDFPADRNPPLVAQASERANTRLNEILQRTRARDDRIRANMDKASNNVLPHPMAVTWRLVERMLLPGDWKEEDPTPSSIYGITPYCPPKHREVEIAFMSCVISIDPIDEKAFHDLLAKQLPDDPPHTLTWPEIRSIEPAIDNKAYYNAFQLKYIYTARLNGEPVLVVEGRYKISGLGCLAIYIESTRTGKFPDVIYFQAPEDPHAEHARSHENLYAKYRPIALQCFKTIVWKSTGAAKRWPSKPPSSDEAE